MSSLITVRIYKAADGWRWQMKRKGRIVADSGEAYTRRNRAVLAANTLLNTNYQVTIEDSKGETKRDRT